MWRSGRFAWLTPFVKTMLVCSLCLAVGLGVCFQGRPNEVADNKGETIRKDLDVVDTEEKATVTEEEIRAIASEILRIDSEFGENDRALSLHRLSLLANSRSGVTALMIYGTQSIYKPALFIEYKRKGGVLTLSDWHVEGKASSVR